MCAELGVSGAGALFLGCAVHVEDCPGVGVVNVGGSGIGYCSLLGGEIALVNSYV